MSLVKSRSQRIEQEDDQGFGPLPCRQCDGKTARVTLANHGGLCYPCFLSYQRGGPAYVPRAFRAYERSGDTVTVADMKTRLRGRLSPPEPRL